MTLGNRRLYCCCLQPRALLIIFPSQQLLEKYNGLFQLQSVSLLPTRCPSHSKRRGDKISTNPVSNTLSKKCTKGKLTGKCKEGEEIFSATNKLFCCFYETNVNIWLLCYVKECHVGYQRQPITLGQLF